MGGLPSSLLRKIKMIPAVWGPGQRVWPHGIIRSGSLQGMKKSIRIGDGIAEFFGTHDGNIKYLESLLKVQVHIDGENNITIDGDDHDVQLVERLVEDYAQLRAEGVKFANGDLKSIIRIISEDTSQSLRGVVSTSKTLQIGKRNVSPKT